MFLTTPLSREAPATESSDATRQLRALCDDVRADLQRARGLIDESVNALSESFAALKGGVREQCQLLEHVVGGGCDGEASGRIENLTSSARLLLGEFSGQIARTRDNGSEVAETMASGAEKITGVCESLEEMDKIAHAIRLLGVNAAIESARSGSNRSSFGVIAEEVRALAHSSTTFAEEIRESATELRDELETHRARMSDIVDRDSDRAHQAEADLTALVEELTELNQRLVATLEGAACRSQSIEEAVGVAVRSLQFGDMVTQLLGSVEKKLAPLLRVVEAVDEAPMPRWRFGWQGNPLRGLLAEAAAEVVETAAAPETVQAESMDGGDIELF